MQSRNKIDSLECRMCKVQSRFAPAHPQSGTDPDYRAWWQDRPFAQLGFRGITNPTIARRKSSQSDCATLYGQSKCSELCNDDVERSWNNQGPTWTKWCRSENEVNESKLKAIRTSTHGWIPKKTGVIKSLYNGFLFRMWLRCPTIGL